MDSKNGLKPVATADAEKASIEYDPFAMRTNKHHATTDRDTLVHLLKASLGTGILAMPYVFKASGLLPGFLAALITSFICTHCSYILVKCAHILYKRTKTSTMSIADVAEVTFANGPVALRCMAPFARYFVTISVFVTYFGSCSVYAVMISDNARQMYFFHTGIDVSIRICILMFMLPLILLSCIRSLKFLAPVSMLANFCMVTGLGITIFYFVKDLPDLRERPIVGDITAIPSSIAITIFAITVAGVVMPLENQMKTPKNFVGVCGVLSRGMFMVTIMYLLVGFLGFWCFGNITEENITKNLPVDEIKAQIVKISVLLAVLLTFSLQLYVCVEIVWNAIKNRFEKRETLANYALRIFLAGLSVLLAILMPSMGPLIKLIGAFGFSSLGLIFPVIIELVICWDTGFGRFNWILYKNIICIAFGLFALIFGTMSAIAEVIEKFT
ncbi:proton-coupled amino acid transporter-like protein pathetic [Sitodiplosis mosellana]|uniref:proton-coupled amino acid transporter-like protein pathetic n=1 Tax=Sitodiplosis mosellana TaxID=263140 RepID=UPI002443FC70|nr:proton-coupled amino acid transporter-like protein pathetic [Sitodiplosis mosellana]